MTVIVNFGMGNLRSIQYKLQKLNITALIGSEIRDIEKADKLILPGVGHFASGMKNLHDSNLIDIIEKKVFGDKVPILGICLGMHLFTKWSEEGNVEGLGWIEAETKRFHFNSSSNELRVPHVGWNNITKKKKSPLLDGIPDGSRFYFTHSYHVITVNNDDIIATTHYGYDFISGIQKENIYGTQFHPEKSHKEGMQIIQNFIKYC